MGYLFLGVMTAFAAFFIGFFIGKTSNRQKKQSNTMSDFELKQALRAQKEYENFLNYNGDEQPDIVL